MPPLRWRARAAVAVALGWSLLAPTWAVAQSGAAPTHTVQPGETLGQIAQAAGTDAASLAKLNGLDAADLLQVGQSLKLPGAGGSAGASGSAAAGGSAGAGSYTVAAGDTLWSIAQQLGTSTTALVQSNALDDPDHLVVGSTLRVPPGASPPAPASAVSAAATPTPAPPPSAAPIAAPPATPAAAAPPPAAGRSVLGTYTVQPGETLNQIAHRLDVRPEAIAQASGLDDPNRLATGTVLKVPMPGREHVVQAGETLSDIAAQEKVDLGSLVDMNALDDPALIHVGQVILVPGALVLQAASAPSATPAATSPPAPSPTVTAAATPSATPTAPATATPGASATPASTPAKAAAAGAPSAAKVASTPAPTAPAAPATPTGPPLSGDGLAGLALKLVGAAYVWGGSSPSGFDCSGFVWYLARQANRPVSRGLLGQYNSGAHPSKDDLKPGDLVFFQNTYVSGLSHNGIYIGGGQFVHAADEAAGVTVSSLGTDYWTSHWFGATRLS